MRMLYARKTFAPDQNINRPFQFQYYYDIKPTCNPLLCLLKFTHQTLNYKVFAQLMKCLFLLALHSLIHPFLVFLFSCWLLLFTGFIFIALLCIYHFFLLWRKRHAKEITNFSTFMPKESFDRLAKRKWSHFYLKEEKSQNHLA